MASFNNPKVTNPILTDVPEITSLLQILAKRDYTGATNIPVGAERTAAVTGGKQIQRFNGTSWVSIGKLMHDTDTLDSYHASKSAVPNTIPVYNNSAQLVGGITGNSATATKLATARTIDIGGIASATEQRFDGSKPITIPINSITVANENDNALVGIVSKAHGGTGRNDGAASDVILSDGSRASDYGQIGYGASATGKNLDSLTVPGNYLSYGMSVENGWPYNRSTGIGVVHVDSRSNYITQILYCDSETIWQRVSRDKGARWSNLLPSGGVRGSSLSIYISKSGSDSNTGTTAENPVLTINRALQIASGWRPTQSGSFVVFYIGEGDWGNLTLFSLPYKLYLRPYTGVANEYSTTLPVFDSVIVENSYIVTHGIVCNNISARYNASVAVDHFCRFGQLSAEEGAIVFALTDSVLEIHNIGSITSVFRSFYMGNVFINANKITVVENINVTSGFIRADSFSNMQISYPESITCADGVSVTGKKYSVYTSVNLGSFTKARLDTLPGTEAGYLDPNAILDGLPWGGGDAHTYLAADGSWNKDSTSIYARDVAMGGDATDLASARGFFYDTRLPRAYIDGPVTDFNDYTVPGKYHISWREGTPYSNDEGVSIPVTLNNPGALNGASGFCDAIMEVDYIGSAAYVSSYARCQQKLILTSSGANHSRVFVRIQRIISGTPWHAWTEIITSSSPELINKLSLYLPLSGGTLTGTLKSSNTETIAQVVDNFGLNFYGGTSRTRGGAITLYGKDHSLFPFTARILANNGTTKNYLDVSLTGITANDKHIVRSVNGVNADADGNVTLTLNTGPYITYSSFNTAGQRSWLREWSNNVRELGGYVTGQNQTVTLPRAFADTNYYVFICPMGGASEIGITNLTTSSFTVVFENTSNGGFFWHAIGKYA